MPVVALENDGCGFLEFGCHINAAIKDLLTGIVQELGNFAADMLTGAFDGATISNGEWAAAQGQFWVWFPIAAVLMLAIGMMQLIPAAILQQGGRVAGIAVAIVAGPFLAMLALRYAPAVVGWSRAATGDVLRGLTGEGIADTVLRLMGFGDSDMAFEITFQIFGDGYLGRLIIATIIIGLIWLASVVLYLSMAMCSFALLVLVAFSPAALMFVGQPIMKDLVARWFQIFLGLLLAPPLAAGVIVMAIRVAELGAGGSIGMLLVAAASIFFASMSPFWAMSLVSFAGEGVGSALEHRMDSSARAGRGARAATALIRRRK